MTTNIQTKSNGKGEFFKQLGVLWGPKTAASGKPYYSGTLNLKELGLDKDVPVLIFENKSKREGRQDPDLQIFLAPPRDGNTSKPADQPVAKTPAPKPEPEPSADPNDDANNVL